MSLRRAGAAAETKIGAYRPGRCPTIAYAPQVKFIDFVDSLREEYPEYRLRCIDNQGIRERIEKQAKIDRIILENNRQKAR